MVGPDHLGPDRTQFGKLDFPGSQIAKMRGKREVRRIRQQDTVLYYFCIEPLILEMGFDVLGCLMCTSGAGEVGLESEGAEVVRDSIVGSKREISVVKMAL